MKALTRALTKYGHIQILKEGYVFTLLMTEVKLSDSHNFLGVQKAVNDFVGERFPVVEVMRNDDNFICMVLKPKSR